MTKFERAISEIGYEDVVYDASDNLPRFVKIARLQTQNNKRSLSFSRKIDLKEAGDNPIYIRLTQEDGTHAWTSPISRLSVTLKNNSRGRVSVNI